MITEEEEEDEQQQQKKELQFYSIFLNIVTVFEFFHYICLNFNDC